MWLIGFHIQQNFSRSVSHHHDFSSVSCYIGSLYRKIHICRYAPCLSLCQYVFKWHWCEFFFVCANGKLVIKWIVFVHRERELNLTSEQTKILYSWALQCRVFPFLCHDADNIWFEYRHYACGSVEWIMWVPLVSAPLLIRAVSDINPSVAWWKKM